MSIYANEIAPHLPPDLRQRAEARLLEAAPHYMWIWRDGGKKTGYCTACGEGGIPGGTGYAMKLYTNAKETLYHERLDSGFYTALPRDLYYPYNRNRREELLPSWRHLDFGTCPRCGAVVQYRSEAVSRRYMIDTVILSYYTRSRLDPDAVVMTLWQGALAWCRWSPYMEKMPELDMTLREVCLMKPGTAGKRYTTPAVWTADMGENQRAVNFSVRYVWQQKKECKSGFWPAAEAFPFEKSRVTGAADLASIRDVFADSPVLKTLETLREVADCGSYYDQIDLVNTVLRYPCTEYLVKMGATALAGLIVDRKGWRLMNYRGKTAQKVLRLDGNTLGWIKGKKVALSARLLELLQARNRLGLRLGNDFLLRLPGRYDAQLLRALADALPPGKREKAIRYMAGRGIEAHDYRDHLRLLDDLNMEKTDDVLYPKDFAALHAALAVRDTMLRQAAQYKQINKQLSKRVKKLDAWWFSALGWTIRPMLSAEEIIWEGTALHHCVGSYVNTYSKGNTILLCLRADEALGAPLYTAEFTNAGHLVQCRGYKNGMQPGWHRGVRMEDEARLEQFWRLFELYRRDYARTHGAKKKGRVAA